MFLTTKVKALTFQKLRKILSESENKISCKYNNELGRNSHNFLMKIVRFFVTNILFTAIIHSK
jgi:hypothetical protein